MDLKVFGAAGQKKLAQYPDRIMQVQQLQDAIPQIEDLNLEETEDIFNRLKRYYKELCAYEVSMRSVISSYQRIINEANKDCDKFEHQIMNAPKDIKEDRKFSLMTSVAQTKQQILFVEQQCKMLEEQIQTVETTKAAVRLGITQNRLANLAPLIALVKRKDTEIRETPR